MDQIKGYDALLLIILLPCITFILAVTLLAMAQLSMEGLGNAIHHPNQQVAFPLVPHAPISTAIPKTL
jgi:hypothetical protein